MSVFESVDLVSAIRPGNLMNNTLSTLINRLEERQLTDAAVIPWSCPVPSFGDSSSARVATLGINPSNREFVDHSGVELDGPFRRFHTLKSLGLARWSDATVQHKQLIWDSCRKYFLRNPYDRWFRPLDCLISGAKASYYGGLDKACHLDLIPYATSCKWTGLNNHQRSVLLTIAGDMLGLLLRDSPIQLLILNGRSVAENFENVSGVCLDRQVMPQWELPRQAQPGVTGIAYKGVMKSFSGLKLRHDVLVLGFNHNIQSSFGVTRQVRDAIRDWIGHTVNGRLP